MKIIINRNELIHNLSDLSLVIKDNSIRPVISGAKLEVKNNEIRFTGTTLETTIKSYLNGEIIEEGIVVFKIGLVLEYIKLLNQDEIEISATENKLFIHNAEFTTLDSEEYPKLNMLGGDPLLEIEANKLVEAFDKVSFSASMTPENLAINTIRMKLEDNKIYLITTDSYRLTHFVLECETKLNKEVSIPLEGATILSKLFRGSKETLNFFIDGSQLKVKSERLVFSIRLVDLVFPDYNAILGSMNSSKTIEMNLKDFKSALKKVLTIAKRNQETKNGAYFDFNGNKLKITVSSGSAKTTQKLDTIKEGDNFKASLNVKFIEDLLNNIEKNIIIRASNASSMFILKEVDNDNYTYILMPLALRD
ncbi:MAG: DNA polymerase III subunit beta [Psychrilyobacter sp.]|uniref:DNA polymerase III subunit beta n=1 Tax=Psychrilyobacter sp. TaxID=2586924 RepID=UPI003C758A1E